MATTESPIQSFDTLWTHIQWERLQLQMKADFVVGYSQNPNDGKWMFVDGGQIRNDLVVVLFRWKCLDNTTHRQSLYETPAQTSPKFKGTEPIQTVSSARTNNSTTIGKSLNTHSRRLSREGRHNWNFQLQINFNFFDLVTVLHWSVEISSVRSLKLKVWRWLCCISFEFIIYSSRQMYWVIDHYQVY